MKCNFLKTDYTRAVLAVLFAMLCHTTVSAQVTIEARIDSAELLIGEQTAIHLETCFDAGSKVQMPVLNDTLTRGVEIVEVLKPDTQKLNDGKRLQVTNTYIVTSFDSAFYYIPPFRITVDGQVYESKALPLKVISIPVDTVHIDKFYGYKDNMEPEFVLSDWVMFFVYPILILLFGALLFYVVKRYRDNKPILRKVHIEPKLPAYEVALKEIEGIKEEKAKYADNPKAYYTILTDALRKYIADRFEFNAMEMTSAEIIDKLMASNDREALRNIKELFGTADLVKFAKYKPMLNENDMNLISAVAFVNSTKIEIPEDKREKPKDIIIEEPRSKKAKELLLYAIIGTSILLCGAVALLGYEIYKLFI